MVSSAQDIIVWVWLLIFHHFNFHHARLSCLVPFLHLTKAYTLHGLVRTSLLRCPLNINSPDSTNVPTRCPTTFLASHTAKSCSYHELAVWSSSCWRGLGASMRACVYGDVGAGSGAASIAKLCCKASLGWLSEVRVALRTTQRDALARPRRVSNTVRKRDMMLRVSLRALYWNYES